MSPTCYNKIMDEQFAIEYYETDTGKCPYLDWEVELAGFKRLRWEKQRNIKNIF